MKITAEFLYLMGIKGKWCDAFGDQWPDGLEYTLENCVACFKGGRLYVGSRIVEYVAALLLSNDEWDALVERIDVSHSSVEEERKKEEDRIDKEETEWQRYVRSRMNSKQSGEVADIINENREKMKEFNRQGLEMKERLRNKEWLYGIETFFDLFDPMKHVDALISSTVIHSARKCIRSHAISRGGMGVV